MKRLNLFILFGMMTAVAPTDCHAQTPAAGDSKIKPVLEAAATDGKFTFIVFTKGDSPSNAGMLKTVRDGIATRAEQSTWLTADANAPAEKAFVEKFGVSRSPMPITIAIAPNGAVTGIFPKTIKDEQLTASIVPPIMMKCMKSLQEQKLVFVCCTRKADQEAQAPTGVLQLQLDPHFKGRIETVSMRVDDKTESRFLEQMKIEPEKIAEPYAVLLAPPGVLIGHYGAKATADEIGAAIHKSGKCCDDPNCKHNHGTPSAQSTPPVKRN